MYIGLGTLALIIIVVLLIILLSTRWQASRQIARPIAPARQPAGSGRSSVA